LQGYLSVSFSIQFALKADKSNSAFGITGTGEPVLVYGRTTIPSINGFIDNNKIVPFFYKYILQDGFEKYTGQNEETER
jgi:hypothetical protein